MKKLLIAIAFTFSFSGIAFAQKEGAVNKISLGGDFAYPIGALADSYSLGFGGSLIGEYNIAKQLNLTLTAGYTSFAYKAEVKELYKESILYSMDNDVSYPIKLGAKYYLNKFYAGADAGIALSLDDDRNSSFAFAGGLGKSFPVAAKSSLELGLRYEGWAYYVGNTTQISSFVGLRLAYSYGF